MFTSCSSNPLWHPTTNNVNTHCSPQLDPVYLARTYCSLDCTALLHIFATQRHFAQRDHAYLGRKKPFTAVRSYCDPRSSLGMARATNGRSVLSQPNSWGANEVLSLRPLAVTVARDIITSHQYSHSDDTRRNTFPSLITLASCSAVSRLLLTTNKSIRQTFLRDDFVTRSSSANYRDSHKKDLLFYIKYISGVIIIPSLLKVLHTFMNKINTK